MTRIKIILAVAAILATLSALAGDIKPFSAHEFEALTQAGKPVVIDVQAPWCPTCKAQKPLIERLMKEPAYQSVTTLMVDFDKDKQVLRRFNVTMQSTLVAFKGTTEVGRSAGDASAAGLEALIKKTVD